MLSRFKWTSWPDIQIPEKFEQKQPDGTVTVLYNIYVKDGCDCWFVARTYNDFKGLHSQLAEQFKSDSELPNLPPERSFFSIEPLSTFLQKRHEQLELYLKQLLQQPRFLHSPALRAFLDPTMGECSAVTRSQRRVPDSLFILPSPPGSLRVPVAIRLTSPTLKKQPSVSVNNDDEVEGFVLISDDVQRNTNPEDKAPTKNSKRSFLKPVSRQAGERNSVEMTQLNADNEESSISLSEPLHGKKNVVPFEIVSTSKAASPTRTSDVVYLLTLIGEIKEKLESLSIMKTTAETSKDKILQVFLNSEARLTSTLVGLQAEAEALRQLVTALTPIQHQFSGDSAISTKAHNGHGSSKSGHKISPESLTKPNQVGLNAEYQPQEHEKEDDSVSAPRNMALLATYLQSCLVQIEKAICWATAFADDMEQLKIASTTIEAHVDAIRAEAERLVLLLVDEHQQASSGVTNTDIQKDILTLIKRVDCEMETLTNPSKPNHKAVTLTPQQLIGKLASIKEFLLSNLAA